MLKNRSDLLALARGFQPAALLFALIELDLASVLDEYPQGATATELATRLTLQERPLTAVLEAATAQGILSYEAGKYANTALSAECLSRQGKRYLGEQLKSYHSQYPGWAKLAQAARTGETVLPDLQQTAEDKAVQQRLLMGLHNSGLNVLPQLLPLLAPYLRQVWRVLDVGSGSGTYSLAIAEKYPQVEAVLLDKPAVLEMAQTITASSAAYERLHFVAADYKQASFRALGEPFDLVLFFQVLRTESPATIRRLLNEASGVLSPGGMVAVYDTSLAQDRTGPLENVYQHLTMTLMYQEGGLFTPGELAGWLDEAGFDAPAIFPLESSRPMTLYVAHKKELPYDSGR